MSAALAAQCQHQPSDSGSWTWREIDGKRCWYEGRRVLPKDQLHWSSRTPRDKNPVVKDVHEGGHGVEAPTRRAVAPTNSPAPPPQESYASMPGDKRPLPEPHITIVKTNVVTLHSFIDRWNALPNQGD